MRLYDTLPKAATGDKIKSNGQLTNPDKTTPPSELGYKDFFESRDEDSTASSNSQVNQFAINIVIFMCCMTFMQSMYEDHEIFVQLNKENEYNQLMM